MQQGSLLAGDSLAAWFSPVVQLYCKDSLFKQDGKVYFDTVNDNQKNVTISANIATLPKWYEDKGDHYMFYLAGLPTNEAIVDLARDPSRELWSNTGDATIYNFGEDDFNLYYIYHQNDREQTELFDMIYSTVSIDTTNTANQNAKCDATFKNQITVRQSITRRPTLTDPIPCFTPLDMFEKFNTGWKDAAPIQMMTDPNGGFRITVLDDISTLRISRQMIYDMGLNSFLTQEGVVNQEPVKHEWKAILLELNKITTDDEIPVYKWQDDYSNPSTIQSHLVVADLDEFVVIDSNTGNATYPLLHNTDVPCFVKQTSSDKVYKAIRITYTSVLNTNIANRYYEGRTFVAPDGLEYLEWKNPTKGAFLGNDNTVSVGSFSIYENIRLVATGFGFQPFIVAGAQDPVLCELRLPYSNQASLASGYGQNQITVTNTTTEFYGDIIYQAPASGHQYLRLNSQQPIFDMTIEPRLIPRNPSLPVERVMLGFSDVFQVKLRFLMRN
jgi:hypothetical protein